ncbi:sensor histidine kinase [Arabiibacter massiliensis]|uniref:sensor histidine kinase n=1 Tax=Arabiibacter massiliensis TaxID=1870985 RepID=UPI0009BAC0DD|nr:HAMP domain-containing sensor histidine kinase [Arabiibacter massiliensis]
MLKKLRLKFVALNMATVAVVLAVVFTAICVIDYQQSVARVQEALDAAVMHAGEAANGPFGGQMPSDEMPEGAAPPEIGGKRGGSDPSIPVAVFSVGEDGALTAVQARTTASLADDVLAQAAAQLADAPEGFDSLDGLGLFYEKRVAGGTTYLAFADMSAARGWQALALTLAGVGVAALAAFLVISVFFSRWALRPVEDAWTRQRRFVADASHDLKTPLTVILANTSILMEHPERSVASQSQWVESTQHEAEQMQGLVGDLLLLAQADEGAAKPAMERLDLADLVEGELLQFESVAFERSIDLHSKLDEDVAVRGNAMRLRKLVGTLLDNACKYADEGGQVDVELHRTARRVELAVRNTGFAIAPEDLPHVFDRFYRADKARTRDEGGYGLGLAIARAIAEEHGGTLTAASDEATGTTFTLALPACE